MEHVFHRTNVFVNQDILATHVNHLNVQKFYSTQVKFVHQMGHASHQINVFVNQDFMERIVKHLTVII